MPIRVLLIQRRCVYLAIAVVCLIGGLSLAIIYRYSTSWSEYDFGEQVVATTGGELLESGHEPVSVALPDDGQTSDSSSGLLETELEETLASARIEYDYGGSSLAAARMSRDYARSREIDLLREALDRSGAGDDVQETQRRLLDLVSKIEAESSAESLIRANGFSDAIVLMADGAVDAVVSCESLDKTDVAVIGGILSRVTGAKLHEIRIREYTGHI